ncbi:MAG: aminopeptidase [Patescibacteria group bacterium]
MKSKTPYHPPQKILERYADVLVNFGLNGGKGIRRGETVLLIISESARPLLIELRKTITRAGGNIILRYIPEDEARYTFSKDFYLLAQKHQLEYFPRHHFKGTVEDTDHVLTVLSEDPNGLKGAPADKISTHTQVLTTLRSLYRKKEEKGTLTWSLALYGTEEQAREAGLSLKAYWEQIIRACFLDTPNPISQWKNIFKKLEKYRNKLTALKIKSVHIKGPDTDLTILLGKKRKWLGGGGSNIPTFEIFVSPDWRGTEGWMKFNQPLYYLGNKIAGVELWFKNGVVVKSKAKTNHTLLQKMIAATNGDKVGEFSLTDKRFSRITKFMAHTLFDENMGGKNGNTHIALGSAYKESYTGDAKKTTPKEWDTLGFNESSVHTDIISTAPRTVTATLANGKEKVIYRNGMFTL